MFYRTCPPPHPARARTFPVVFRLCSFVAMVDVDGDGLISYEEYMLFCTLLAVPRRKVSTCTCTRRVRPVSVHARSTTVACVASTVVAVEPVET